MSVKGKNKVTKKKTPAKTEPQTGTQTSPANSVAPVPAPPTVQDHSHTFLSGALPQLEELATKATQASAAGILHLSPQAQLIAAAILLLGGARAQK